MPASGWDGLVWSLGRTSVLLRLSASMTSSAWLASVVCSDDSFDWGVFSSSSSRSPLMPQAVNHTPMANAHNVGLSGAGAPGRRAEVLIDVLVECITGGGKNQYFNTRSGACLSMICSKMLAPISKIPFISSATWLATIAVSKESKLQSICHITARNRLPRLVLYM